MDNRFATVIVPVKDLEGAKAFYSELLGTGPAQDSEYYVGFELEGQTVGLNPHGFEQGLTGPVPYRAVEDLEAAIAALTAAGGEVRQKPQPVGGGRTIATVADADGNIVGLTHDE
ncbi:VOC family protein [Salininema proteolyticum]|uniref:VOC family protein n=1 Tax=Salininema proteolyticum TaxID=1607685 RepID=A0ABV8U493_9ACTN